MKNLKLLSISVLGASLLLTTAYSIGAPSNRIKYLNPSIFVFKMFASSATSCTQLNEYFKKYKALDCINNDSGAACQTLLTVLKSESSIDLDSEDISKQFLKTYFIKNWENAPKGNHGVLKRFDVAFADSYDFMPTKNSAFRFEGSLTAIELDVEVKMSLPTDINVVKVDGRTAFQFASRIRACAMEDGRISILGKDAVNVRGEHPFERAAFSIVDNVYNEAVSISERSDLNPAEKSYLLGIAAGTALKELSGQLADEKEVSAVALSLQRVIMDMSNPGFEPFKVDKNKGFFSLQLLEPGFTQQNANVQIVFAKEQLK